MAGPGPFARPPALRPGDPVAVVAPASPFDAESFEAGLAVLGRRYRVVCDEGLRATTRYLAGPDARRLGELLGALADGAVRAVFAARGGYGTLRLLPQLAPRLVRDRPPPKAMVGFSDLTALHLVLQAAGWVSVHGPVVTQLATQPPEVLERLYRLLESPTTVPGPLAGVPVAPGTVEGPLLGGNLSVLTRLLGTPYLPPLEGAVLLLEDVGERPYRLDRMWTHLRLAGVFQRVVGLALGQFTDCEEPGADYRAEDVLRDLVAETGLPCVAGLPVGHRGPNEPLPLGCRVRLDGTTGRLEVLEPAVVPAV